MKNLKLFTVLIAIGSILMITSCAKDGETGPIGQAGADGINGTNANSISTADQTAYNAANGITGGLLWDHVVGQKVITDPTIKDFPNFFRCKQCHGWDYLGNKGAYINRAPNAGRPDVAPNNIYAYSKTHNIREIFDAIKHVGGRKVVQVNNSTPTERSYNANHPDYSSILTDADIWDLVKFLKEEAHNVFDFYDMATSGSYPTGTKTYTNIGLNGNAANGLAVYTSKCASCHGADGTTINVYCGGEYMGDFFRHGPHELQHKAKFGMPFDYDHQGTCSFAGSMDPATMGLTASEIRDLLVAGQDSVAFPAF